MCRTFDTRTFRITKSISFFFFVRSVPKLLPFSFWTTLPRAFLFPCVSRSYLHIRTCLSFARSRSYVSRVNTFDSLVSLVHTFTFSCVLHSHTRFPRVSCSHVPVPAPLTFTRSCSRVSHVVRSHSYVCHVRTFVVLVRTFVFHVSLVDTFVFPRVAVPMFIFPRVSVHTFTFTRVSSKHSYSHVCLIRTFTFPCLSFTRSYSHGSHVHTFVFPRVSCPHIRIPTCLSFVRLHFRVSLVHTFVFPRVLRSHVRTVYPPFSP